MITLPRRYLNKDMTTFKGRVNTVLEYLKTEFPNAQIVMFTLTHRAYFTCGKTNVQPDESFPNPHGLYVDDYCNAICEAGKIWSVPVIDLFGECGLCPRIENQGNLFANPQTDRLHPSSEGHRRIAMLLATKLRTLPATFKKD
jgi:lysophospholipase L1-like esterase